MLSDIVFVYILGCLLTSNLLGIWFKSTIFLHLISFLTRRRIYTFEELIDFIDGKSSFLAELLSCTWCLGTWVSLSVAIILAAIFSLGYLFVLGCMFSWPLIATEVFKIDE